MNENKLMNIPYSRITTISPEKALDIQDILKNS